MHCPAGVYIPMLAQQIDTKGGINLKVRGAGTHSLTSMIIRHAIIKFLGDDDRKWVLVSRACPRAPMMWRLSDDWHRLQGYRRRHLRLPPSAEAHPQQGKP